MDLDTYTLSLRNTAENLPGVLAGWSRLDEALQMHYADEVLRVVLDINEARLAAMKEQRLDLLSVIGNLTHRLREVGELVERIMGLELSSLLAPPGTSLGRGWSRDAGAVDERCAQAA